MGEAGLEWTTGTLTNVHPMQNPIVTPYNGSKILIFDMSDSYVFDPSKPLQFGRGDQARKPISFHLW